MQRPIRASLGVAASRMVAAGSRGVHDASWPGPCVRHPRVQRVLRNQLRRRHRGGPEPGMGRTAAKTASLSVTIGGRGHLRPGRDPRPQWKWHGSVPALPAAIRRSQKPRAAGSSHRPFVLGHWRGGPAVKRAGRRVAVPALPAIPRSKFCRNRGIRRISASGDEAGVLCRDVQKNRGGAGPGSGCGQSVSRQRLHYRPSACATSGALRCILAAGVCGVFEPHGRDGHPNKFNTRRGGAGL